MVSLYSRHTLRNIRLNINTHSPLNYHRENPADMIPQLFPSSDEGCAYVAQLVIDRITEFAPSADKPFVLGLPTGSSPEGVYRRLVEAHKNGLSFRHVVTFNMDEYCGLAPSNDQSYHYFMNHHFFSHVDIPKCNIHILNGQAEDFAAECTAYEAKIASFGGIKLFLAGVGVEGHIAFNEKGSTRDSRTRQVFLDESTIRVNSRFFEDPALVPRSALSVGVSTVLDAYEVVILAFGFAKAEAVKKTLLAEISADCPSTFAREHTNSQLIIDTGSASGLGALAQSLPMHDGQVQFEVEDLVKGGKKVEAK